MNTQDSRSGGITPQVLFGLCVAAVGLLFTLDNLGIVESEPYWRYWPSVLIVIGLVKLWQARGEVPGTAAGLVFVAAGTFLQIQTLRLGFASVFDLWPLVLVFIGGSMVLRGMRAGRPQPRDSNDTLSAVAILGGVTRGNNSPSFKGGDLTAVMGGCEIDLRKAGIDGEAFLEVFAMWGGIDIRVPEDWTVESRVTPLLGGVDDKTRPPQGSGGPRLIVRGIAIMGGIEIKN